MCVLARRALRATLKAGMATKIQIGDLVKYQTQPQVWKLHPSALEAMRYVADITNPQLIYVDDKNVPPDLEQEYLVTDVKDLFDRNGYHKRLVKIAGWGNENDPVEGWLPQESLFVTING